MEQGDGARLWQEYFRERYNLSRFVVEARVTTAGALLYRAMIKRFVIACCVVGLTAAPVPAQADQVHFTGTTRVDAVVIHDALQQVLTVATAVEHCNQLSAVEARTLPPGYRPPHPSDAVPATALYEWWDVMLCGRTVPFVLAFWPAPEGGYMFAVIYLYPGERARP